MEICKGSIGFLLGRDAPVISNEWYPDRASSCIDLIDRPTASMKGTTGTSFADDTTTRVADDTTSSSDEDDYTKKLVIDESDSDADNDNDCAGKVYIDESDSGIDEDTYEKACKSPRLDHDTSSNPKTGASSLGKTDATSFEGINTSDIDTCISSLLELASGPPKQPAYREASTRKPKRVCWKTFVDETWVNDIVRGVPVFTNESTREYRNFIESEYGIVYNKFARPEALGVIDSMIKKLQILDYVILLMSKEPIQDTRLDGSKTFILSLSAPHTASTQQKTGHCLLLGRIIFIGDVLAFDQVLRRVQYAYPNWGSGGSKAKGTKGITEALCVIGLGPHPDAVAWKVRNGGFRGFEETDPDNPWDLEPGQSPVKRETDGLYFKQLCFGMNRVETVVLRSRSFRRYAAGESGQGIPKTSRKRKTRFAEQIGVD